MSNLERALLYRMTTEAGMQVAVEEKLDSGAFVEPIHRHICGWMFDYFSTDSTAPTPDVLAHEFPHLKFQTEDIEEGATTAWLVDAVQFRTDYANQLQQAMADVVRATVLDPRTGIGTTRANLAEAAVPLHKALDALIAGRPPIDVAFEHDVTTKLYEKRVYEEVRRRYDEEMAEGPTSWEPVDLGPYLRGEIETPEPTLGVARTDGLQFLYPGLEHALIAETEAGKTWVADACVAAEIANGNRVVYVHYEEADPTSTIERLLLLGADPDDTEKLLTFVGPCAPVREEYLAELLDPAPTLVIHDGVNQAMAMQGAITKDVEGAALFRQRLVVPFLAAGAATLACDHFPMSHDSSRRDAYGSVHKGNALSGARFSLENVEPFGRGMRGRSRLFVTKDRPGFLKEHGRPTKNPNVRFFGTLVIDNTRFFEHPRFELALHAPTGEEPVDQDRPGSGGGGLLAEAIYTIVANQPDHTIESRRMLFARLRLAMAGGFSDTDARKALDDLLFSQPPRLTEVKGRRGAKGYRAVVTAS
jgi:hypothetical protein